MKDWIHFKEEREKARQYVEKMTKSAIIVQAWWRGLLVRRPLKRRGAPSAFRRFAHGATLVDAAINFLKDFFTNC
jgi:hypothetical protein